MKSINTQLKNLAIASLRQLTPIEISAWQDWLRGLADALPALRRDEEVRTLDELRACSNFAKHQERLRLEFFTQNGQIPAFRWNTGDPSDKSRKVSYTERTDQSISVTVYEDPLEKSSE